VMDTGKGIPPEFLPHIFDPFFSTKGEVGTGLGLSVSYGIIKNHKGNIKVESKVGVGTTFTIELPIYKNGI
ncbi:MAG: ATP-binding protein, partial [Nitrospirae bacterium]|nr:ATP-binding protein [Nitrospirota bacterium]